MIAAPPLRSIDDTFNDAASKPLLLVHDIVESGANTEEQASWRTCIHNATLLIEAARRQHWRVVHSFKSQTTLEPVNSVRPLPEEPVFQCKGPSALSSFGLRQLLAFKPPSEILLVGRSLLPMCLATAAACADLGLRLSVVSDAVSLSLETKHAQSDWGVSSTLKLLPLFAAVTTTAQVLKLSSSINLLNRV